ncbi:hypothetical protein HQ524_03095 [Candidatus Uhrbacteria bacterium]|nr:hypothetical protein [Candidatus Uhrbacteria bacterium]
MNEAVDRPGKYDILLKRGFRLMGGKESARWDTTMVRGADVYYTNRRLRIYQFDDVVIGERALEAGVVLVHNGETDIYGAYADLYDAVSSQTHAAQGYGIDLSIDPTGELGKLDGLLRDAAEAHRLAIEYSSLDSKAFERALRKASAIFADLKLARDGEKVHARKRAVIISRLVASKNPGATAATALAILGNLQRRTTHVAHTLAPGVDRRAQVLIELRNRFVWQYDGLLNSLLGLSKFIQESMDRWEDNRDMDIRRNAVSRLSRLIGEWMKRVAPSPFNAFGQRTVASLLLAERHLHIGSHEKALRYVIGILQDIDRMLLLHEIESMRYTVLKGRIEDPDLQCRQVGKLIAIARQIDEEHVDEVKVPNALNAMFSALFAASQGDLKQVRADLKGASFALN